VATSLTEKDKLIAEFVMRLGIAIQQGEVVATDVLQAMTAKDDYTIECPLHETDLGGPSGNVGRKLLDMLKQIEATPEPRAPGLAR